MRVLMFHLWLDRYNFNNALGQQPITGQNIQQKPNEKPAVLYIQSAVWVTISTEENKKNNSIRLYR